jgi:hypothetical protein
MMGGASPWRIRKSSQKQSGAGNHWTMSNFSLMDAIECGIVKLPRVPVAENYWTRQRSKIESPRMPRFSRRTGRL